VLLEEESPLGGCVGENRRYANIEETFCIIRSISSAETQPHFAAAADDHNVES